MRILVVNDDGIDSAGIEKLARISSKLGEVWVVAPASQCSAMSQKITIRGSMLVKEKTDFDSIAAYKEDIKNSMVESNESTAKNSRRTAIWNELVAKSAVKQYDEEEVKKYILDYKKYMENVIYNSYSMTFEAYLSASGMEAADFKESAVTNALAAAKEQMVIDAIAAEEKLEVTDEDFQEYLADYMENVGVTSEDELWSKFEEQGSVKEEIIESMKDSVRAEKVMTFIEKTVVEK